MHTLLKRTLVIILAAGAAYHFFFYWDPFNGCFIRIAPALTEFSNSTVKDALRVLKAALPADYKNVCTYVSVVNPNFSCGGVGGGCYFAAGSSPSRTIDISTSRHDIAWTAAVIVHETCHAKQHAEGRGFSEDECYLDDDGVLRSIVDVVGGATSD